MFDLVVLVDSLFSCMFIIPTIEHLNETKGTHTEFIPSTWVFELTLASFYSQTETDTLSSPGQQVFELG